MLRVVVAAVMVVGVMTVGAPSVRADGIVLESYTGERPADAPRLLAPVLEELSRKKFAAGDSVARQFDSQVSRASRLPKGIPSDFAAQVDKGFKAWVGGKFDESIKILVPLIENAHANTGWFAMEPSLREPLQKGLIALSLAQQRIGDPGAMRGTMGELVRSFPEAGISRATYGPEAATAFDQVRKELQGAGKGKLNVKVNGDAGVVFINEAYRAAGSTTAELIPGDYRVIVMVNKQPSRSHRVTVRANEESAVDIDVTFDLAIRTTGHTGFQYADDNNRQSNEAMHAARFARAIGASAVAVLGIDEVRGKSSIVGSLVSLQTGREIRRASIPLEPDPSTDRLVALARFLGGEEPAKGLDVQFSRAAPADKGTAGTTGGDGGGGDDGGRDATTSNRWGGWRWMTGVIGLGGLIAGGVLVGLDGRCPTKPMVGQPCNDVYVTANSGYLTLGGGALFMGISIYLFATHKTAPVIQPVAGSEGATGARGYTFGFVTSW